MRKPRGGQILANRVIGPREVLGGGDRRVPAKGRGRTEPHRGRSGASWIWSTPLHTGASEGEFRSGYALTPSPSHSKNISLFTERRTSERTVSEDGYSSFLFNPLWGFPVVAAGILFVVDHPYQRLIELLLEAHYQGWALLEAHDIRENRVQAMIEQRRIFEEMVDQAQRS